MPTWIRRSFRKLKKRILHRRGSDSAVPCSSSAADEEDVQRGDKEELQQCNSRLQVRLEAATVQYQSLLSALLLLRDNYEKAVHMQQPFNKYEKMKAAIKESVHASKQQPQATAQNEAKKPTGLLGQAEAYLYSMHQYKRKEEKLNMMSKSDLRLENQALSERLESFSSTSYQLKWLFNRLEQDYEKSKRLVPMRRYGEMKHIAKIAIAQVQDAQNRQMTLTSST